MGRNHVIRAKLRDATAQAHSRVDAVFSRFDLSSVDGYGRFLQAQAAALIPLERALDAGPVAHLGIDWPARRRSHALLVDLAALGLSAPAGEDVRPIADEAAALGTVYVLEGSRLGGALLKRSVPANLPTAFLAPGDPAMWRALLVMLERALTSPAQQAAAIEAAEAAFALFERSGRAAMPVERAA